MSSMSKLPLRFSTEKRKWTRVGVCNSPPSKSRKVSESKSPEPNCPICLGSIDGESFANGCFHSFCRTCLFEWSKVKAECPVCRRPFDNIIFNVKSPEEYEQLRVKAHRPDQYQAASTFTAHLWTAGHIPSASRFMPPSINLFSNSPSSLSIRIGRTSQSVIDFSRNFINPFQPRWNTGANALPHPTSVEFRRRLYTDNMWAKSDDRRTRISSAPFYRDNPALTHRLQPFVYRELSALMDSEFEAHRLAQRVMDTVLQNDIRSRSFRRVVESYLVSNTDHFIHEFYSFAISPYELNEYDHYATYVPQAQTIVLTTVPPVPPMGINYEVDEPEDRPPRLRNLLTRIRNATASESPSNRRTIACIDLSDDSDDETKLTESTTHVASPPRISTPPSEPTIPTASAATTSTPSTSVGPTTATTSTAQAQPESNFNINIIDDFDNPQPGPSGMSNRGKIQVNIKCASRRLMSFCDSDDGESDIEVDSSKPHSFVPIFPSMSSESHDQDASNDSIVFIAEEKPEPDVIDVSSDEEVDVEQEHTNVSPHSSRDPDVNEQTKDASTPPPPTQETQASVEEEPEDVSLLEPQESNPELEEEARVVSPLVHSESDALDEQLPVEEAKSEETPEQPESN